MLHMEHRLAKAGAQTFGYHLDARPGVTMCQVCGRLVIRDRGAWWDWQHAERWLALAAVEADFRLRNLPTDKL